MKFLILQKTIIIFFISLSIISTAIAQISFQEGYIITSANIKINGKIKQIDKTSIKFIDSTHLQQTIYADNLKSYYTGSYHYIIEPVIIDGITQKVILKELITGYVSFYSIRSVDEEKYFAIKKGNDSCVFISKSDAAYKMRVIMYDCHDESILQSLSKQYFLYNEPEIISTIKKYNRLQRPQQAVNESKGEFKITFGVESGISFNNMIYYNKGRATYKSEQVFLPPSVSSVNGFFLAINPHKVISFQIGAYFNTFAGRQDLPLDTYSTKLVDTLHIVEKSIAVPILLKYTKKIQNTSLFIAAGPKFVFERTFDGYIQSYYNSSFPIFFENETRKGIGYNFSIGAEKRVAKFLVAKIEYRYSRHILVVGNTNTGNVSAHQIIIGIAFGK